MLRVFGQFITAENNKIAQSYIQMELHILSPITFGRITSDALKGRLHLVGQGRYVILQVSLYIYTTRFEDIYLSGRN